MINGLMIDIETMSTRSNASILSIGAAWFTTNYNGKVYDRGAFYNKVSLSSCVNYGLHIDPDTIMWWLERDNDARLDLLDARFNISVALSNLSEWIHQSKSPDEWSVWGNGSDFDLVILGNAFKATGIQTPWNHRQHRCYRTLKSLYPDIKIPNEGVKHNALNDAIWQAKHLVEIFKVIGL